MIDVISWFVFLFLPWLDQFLGTGRFYRNVRKWKHRWARRKASCLVAVHLPSCLACVSSNLDSWIESLLERLERALWCSRSLLLPLGFYCFNFSLHWYNFMRWRWVSTKVRQIPIKTNASIQIECFEITKFSSSFAPESWLIKRNLNDYPAIFIQNCMIYF